MPQHLSDREQDTVDNYVRCKGKPAMQALEAINKERMKNGIDLANKSTVYRYINGETHRRGRAEKRGRPKSMCKGDETMLYKTRKKLIQKANGQHRVTHADVLKKSGLHKTVCQRVAEDALRGRGVRYRRPREKIYITEADAKIRRKTCQEWAKKRKPFWNGSATKSVKAYIDNKSWPLPLTPAQRARCQQAQITGHLRTPAEGIHRGFTKPREKHSFIGMPSANICAAVGGDRVMMWHAVGKSWNGQAAADMYQGPLLTALRKSWGEKPNYIVCEDGDRKGFQSNKGIKAKAKAKIVSLKLPPRTPSLMPWDYALWQQIQERMNRSAPKGVETKAKYLSRLRKTALSLPRPLVRKIIDRMSRNVEAIVEAKGWQPKND